MVKSLLGKKQVDNMQEPMDKTNTEKDILKRE